MNIEHLPLGDVLSNRLKPYELPGVLVTVHSTWKHGLLAKGHFSPL